MLVATCTTDLYTEDKEILVKPAVVSVENNTDFSDAATNTDVMQKGDASAQTEVPVTKYCDASTQTDYDKGSDYSKPLHIEQIQDNCNAIKFYTGFPSFQLLMACFTFLGPAVSMLSYEDHIKLTKGKPHKLSPLNEFL